MLELNACENCVDRHLGDRKDQDALVFVPEREEHATEHITYGDLHRRVKEFAHVAEDFGVSRLIV